MFTRVAEMRMLRSISGNMLKDKIINEWIMISNRYFLLRIK